MDKQMLSNMLTESLERAALRDREIFAQETIDRFKAKKQKETEQTKNVARQNEELIVNR